MTSCITRLFAHGFVVALFAETFKTERITLSWLINFKSIETRSRYIRMRSQSERDEDNAVNVGRCTNYRRFLLRHLTKSPSSRVTSRSDRFFFFFFFFFHRADTTTNGVRWQYTVLTRPKYFKFSLLLTYTYQLVKYTFIQQFRFNCSIPPQRDYLTKFYISYIFLHMSNFWNFIFRNNAIDESDHSYLVQIPRCEVNCSPSSLCG